MYTLRATRTAYPFENGGENRPSKAYFTQLVADAVWENIPLTFNFINQFRATIIVKWDDYTLFELSDSNNRKSYWTNENINKILTNGYELEVNKDIYLSHGMELLDSWRKNRDMLIDIDRAHVIYRTSADPKYRSFSVWSNIKKDRYLDNIESYGVRNCQVFIVPDKERGTNRDIIWLNQRLIAAPQDSAYLIMRQPLPDLLNGCLYFVFREPRTGRTIAIPILHKAISVAPIAFLINSSTGSDINNSYDYLLKEIVNNVKFINQFEGLFYGPNIVQWTSGLATNFTWLDTNGQPTTINDVLNVAIPIISGVEMNYYSTSGRNVIVPGKKRLVQFGRWFGGLNVPGITWTYNMNFISRLFFGTDAETTYYKPKLTTTEPSAGAQTNFIAWMSQFKNGINNDNIITNGLAVLGTSTFTVDFSNGFIATKKMGASADIETDSADTINGGVDSAAIIWPNGLPSSSDGYIKYVSSVMDTMNTGANQISQNERVNQGNNLFSGVMGLFSGAKSGGFMGAFSSLAGTASKMGSAALQANQARASMKSAYTDKVRTLTSNVYNGSVADIIFKNLNVANLGPQFSYGQMANEYSDAGLIDANQRIFLYGNLVDSVEKMGTLFPRPFYNFISIKTGWLKHNLKQYFPSTNATLFGEILNDLSLGMRVCEVAPDWQTNPVHQVN